ncbi:hypothetical protein SDRG_08695 [Saprolegnia diclina VS20]|uniref:Uncharacterized protein n=1 Tax=Saprolegnia diclina (strain VS20) TaxID=1156394 RepID=T0RTG9_SAPDV|nr:hypothetical protein SDRG_08695 [Saprolegnia diclina VS20]EQC33587.1 hypothetical protein SDRG_08695 [Saprolegnia diclina VS20]|eukprot:XP_008612810.1 hypothetical protein SDRG_08695 [Saprolegnia diclina VS20]
MAISFRKVHQVALAVCGLLATTAAIWSFIGDGYGGSFESLTTRVALRVYYLGLSLVLVSVACLGLKKPLAWFGLLEGYIGSGLYVIFLAFFTLGLGNGFGFYTTLTLWVVGAFSIFYGVIVKDDRSNYPPLLG